jgi:hypothetical protein
MPRNLSGINTDFFSNLYFCWELHWPSLITKKKIDNKILREIGEAKSYCADEIHSQVLQYLFSRVINSIISCRVINSIIPCLVN